MNSCKVHRKHLWFAFSSLILLSTQPAFAARGELEIQVVDEKTQKPLAARMHLMSSKDRRQRVSGVPNWGNHFSFVSKVILELPPGEYHFELEAGPQYLTQTGYFTLKSGDQDNKTIEMQRFAHLEKQNWYSGDLHLQRHPTDIETIMMAEDLNVAVNITWNNQSDIWSGKPLPKSPHAFDGNRMSDLLGGIDQRAGGTLLFANLNKPLPVQNFGAEYPSPLLFLRDIEKSKDAHVAAASPWEWDLPLWVAHDLIDSINVANYGMQNHVDKEISTSRSKPAAELPGKPRDQTFYAGDLGLARWGQDIYFHLLNCGLRIPPSAGSGSGFNGNPPGYNRAYVYCPDKYDYASWLANLKQGKVVISNGPLIRPSVEGQMPGHVFQYKQGTIKEFEVGLSLSTREKINYLEVIQDGKIKHEISMDEYDKRGGTLPPLVFDKSGWFLVRAVTQNPDNYRFAMTGPYYVQIGDQPTISKKSALFFYDWVFERIAQIEIENETQRTEIMELHRTARNFWRDIYNRANAE
ncbi:MAG: hypothetical protein COA78_24130 [Blastopirellula sp.]|nr:MAG: hypothetical protein COA78_24130 [Blastopirellula sp.]